MSETTIPPEFYANHRDTILRILCAMRLDGPDEPRALIDHAAAIAFELVSRSGSTAIDPRLSATHVDNAPLSVRAYNVLRDAEINDLRELEHPARLESLYYARNCGPTTFRQIKQLATEMGVKIPSLRVDQ